MPAPEGNQFAAKPDAEKQTAQLSFRVTARRRKAYLKAAAGGKLVDWLTLHLDAAAGYNEPVKKP